MLDRNGVPGTLATVGEVKAPQEKQEGSMTLIAADKPPVRGWIMDLLQAFSHKLIVTLDRYGQTRVHHTASRAQMQRAQRDVILMRQAMHPHRASTPERKAATEPVTDQ
jgi:hypothetical protein